jgi:hypothetical protein
MRQINDPIQPGAEQILLTGLLSLPRPHRSPSLVISRARNHSLRFEGIAKQFARKPQRRHPIPAKAITWKGSITHLVQRLGNTSRATKKGLRSSHAHPAPKAEFQTFTLSALFSGLWQIAPSP